MTRGGWTGAAAGVAAGLLASAAAIIWAEPLSRPPADPPPAFARLVRAYPARIVRDDFGVPHVFGATDPDVAFGLAYAHCEDDFPTIRESLLTARGALASDVGPRGAPTDYLVRLMRVRESVDADYVRALPPDVRAVLEAYAAGVTAYAERHPAAAGPGLLPVTGRDIAAAFAFRTPFFYGLDAVFRKLAAPARPGPPTGSNGVAAAPSRTADGATRLLVNSHQPYAGQVAWYEAVLQSDAGWHVAGGFFPGSPFMLHGHNARLGWASTVDQPKLYDVYRLVLDPRDPGRYRLDGAWRRLATADARIRIRIAGPLRIIVHRPLEWSEHGPVFRASDGAYAVRYAGMGEIRQALAYYRLDRAETKADWVAALRLQALPSLNFIYADATGTIGFVHNGLYPDRRAGWDWRGVQPGDRSDLIWRRYLPFERTPQIWSPRSGLVFNANNTPFRASEPADNLDPAAFPASMGLETNMTNRALREEETFGADRAVTDASFRAAKFDLAYSRRSDVARIVAEALAAPSGADPALAAAQAVLRGWDLRTDIHNRAAALGVLTALRVRPDPADPADSEAPAAALRAVASGLRRQFGRIDPEWGEVNRIRRGAVDLPIDGGPDTLRAVYGRPDAAGRLEAEAGDTYIMFVTWDRAGRVSSQSVHQFGSATSVPGSRHYADQTPLFVAMRTKPVRFDPAELRGHIEADYRPGEPHGEAR